MTDAPLDDIDTEFDTDFGESAPRISLRLGGLEVEVEGDDETSLEEIETTYYRVLEDALSRGEDASAALQDRLMRGFR